MNKQILSFTYNFDTSHLNNGNNTNESTQDNGKNDNENGGNNPLQNSSYFSNLQNNFQMGTPMTSNNNYFTNPFQQNNNVPQSPSPFAQNGYQQTSLQTSYNPLTSNYYNSTNNLNIPNNNNMMSNNNLVANNNQLMNNNSNNNTNIARSSILNPLINNTSQPLMTNSTNPLASSMFNFQMNGMGITEGEDQELKDINLSQFQSLVPVEDENKEKTKEVEDDYSNLDQKEPIIQNVISTFNLDCKLDLQKIQKKARNTEYHPKRFAALVMRIKSPQTTALIFSSGKVVVTGAKSKEKSSLACKKFARIIKKLDFPAHFKDFKIQNIVASCEVGYKVSLETLVTSEHGNSCRYEPELFPGLIYKMIEPKVTLLIFVSGKIVITGARDKKGVIQAFKNISPVLINYKK